MGQVAEEVCDNSYSSNYNANFFFPFVEAEKTYKIRLVFYREEDDDGNGFVIDYKNDDGVVGWFETELTAGPESKGEVRFTSKGKISVNKKGDFRFTQKPIFTNEHLLNEEWAVDIGVVEGISWEHGAERKTKWHSTQIPNDKLTETRNLYENQETEYSIDFICVRPIMSYKYDGKTYNCMWESFVQDIYYPPLEPEFLHGIYLELDLPKEEFSRCDVIIDGIGKVAEEVCVDKNKASFFYPFVEPGKEYTIRFSFKKVENTDGEFTIPTPNDTISEYSYRVTVGAKSKGEVHLISKGKVDAASTKQGNFKFTEKPAFQNEHLLGDDWQIELGLMEGISWEHGDERRTYWHTTAQIPKAKLGEAVNLYNVAKENSTENYSIDCICIRPILWNYEYKGKTYNYMWDDFTRDIYYPLRNPDGIYLEFDVPKSKFSRCDVIIDGIGKVAEEVCVDKNKASFFYPFVEPNKDYTIHFSFKKPEPVDSEGFVIPTHGNDTINEVTKTVTAGSRAKGEVRLLNPGGLKADSECNITYFAKPQFQNEHLLGNDWQIELGMVEGISWEHGDERRTKWHCAVRVPNNYTLEHCNLRGLPSEHEFYEDHSVHKIDFLCVRPVMSYEYDKKTYNYMWDGFTSDVNYPMNTYFEEIDINDPTDVEKIKGIWTQKQEWDDTERFSANVHAVWNETLVIDNKNVSRSYLSTYKKTGSAFTKQEIIDEFCYYVFSNDLPENYFDYEEGEFDIWDNIEMHKYKYKYKYKIYYLAPNTTLSEDGKTITDKDEYNATLSEYFGNFNDYEHSRAVELKLSSDKSELWILTYGTDDGRYYEWTDVYYKQ